MDFLLRILLLNVMQLNLESTRATMPLQLLRSWQERRDILQCQVDLERLYGLPPGSPHSEDGGLDRWGLWCGSYQVVAEPDRANLHGAFTEKQWLHSEKYFWNFMNTMNVGGLEKLTLIGHIEGKISRENQWISYLTTLSKKDKHILEIKIHIIKEKILLGATRDRKLYRALITHNVNEYGIYSSAKMLWSSWAPPKDWSKTI